MDARTWPILLVALAAPLGAQSFNLDIGDVGAGPPPTYAAAGLAGHWNSFPAPHTSGNPGPTAFDVFLTDVNGVLTSVRMHQFGGTELINVDDPTISGDDATLLEDAILTHSIPLKSCLFFNGLANGTYEVLTYAWVPNHPEVMNLTFIDNSPGAYLVGGTWSGSHALGLTYSRHIVPVTTGFMGPHAGLPDDGDTVIGGALNGMQIRRLTCTGCMLYCYGDGGGTACPCGNSGIAGRGCAHSFSASGAELTSTGVASVAGDTVLLTASGLPSSTTIVFFQGTTQSAGGSGVVFGDGLQCAGGVVVRLGARIASGGVATLGVGDGTGGASVSVRGAVPPGGGFRTYQGWYRNSQAFCTAAQFNLTNGMSTNWAP